MDILVPGLLVALALLLVAVLFLLLGRRAGDRSEAETMRQQLALAMTQQSETVQRVERSLREQEQALAKVVVERLDRTEKATGQIVTDLRERLVRIDEAQKKIGDLSTQVVSLQEVLSNKQARGAFGQAQMEEIVRDGLPSTLYDFQFTLSNRNRPDCVIRIPGNKALLVIDSKFPLEGFEFLRRAATDDEKKLAQAQVRAAVGKHVADIAEKYLIPGEVQTPAIMFVPSESLYADLHDGFADVIQKAHRANVIVVSPNILMLAINTIQTVMKDARMREQADLIRKEVGVLLNDVRLLSDRVLKLQSHFNQADADIKNILISTGKITGRAEKIEKVELAPPETVKNLT